MLVAVDKWSLFGGGRYLRFDCMRDISNGQLLPYFKKMSIKKISRPLGPPPAVSYTHLTLPTTPYV